MNQNIKILEVANSCTVFDDLFFKDASFCIKTRFLNALLNRWEGNYTQNDVAHLLKISKRSVSDLEKGKNSNLVLVLNYIQLFGIDNAEINKTNTLRKHYKRKNNM